MSDEDLNEQIKSFWVSYFADRQITKVALAKMLGDKTAGAVTRWVKDGTLIEGKALGQMLERRMFSAAEAARIIRLFLRRSGFSEAGISYVRMALNNEEVMRSSVSVEGWLAGGTPRTLDSIPSFFKSLLKGSLQIVVGRNLSKIEEVGGYLAVTDLQALVELRTYLGSVGLLNIPIAFADQLKHSGDQLKTNLLLLAGGSSNYVSGRIIERIQPTFVLREVDLPLPRFFVEDLVTGERYAPPVAPTNVTHDFGVIIKAKNPFDKSRNVLLVGGVHGYGTWAGIRLIQSEEFLNHPVVLSGDDFECLVRTDVEGNAPQTITALEYRRLKEVGS